MAAPRLRLVAMVLTVAVVVLAVTALLAVRSAGGRSDKIERLTGELDSVSDERDDLISRAEDERAGRAVAESRWLAAVALDGEYSRAQNRLLAVEALSRSETPEAKASLGRLLFADVLAEPPTRALDHEGPVWIVDVAAEVDLVVTGSDDNTTRLWSTTGELQRTLTHPGRVRAVDLSGDDQHLAVGSSDGTAAIWTVEGDEVASVQHADQVNTIATDATGSVMVSGGSDGLALVTDIATGKVHLELEHPDTVWTLDLSVGADRIATGSQDGIARIWDMETGAAAATYEVGEPVTVVEFSPDGAWLFVGGQRGTAFVVDYETGEAGPLLEGDFPGGVVDMDWHPGGAEIAVVSLGSINRYELATNDPVGAHRLTGGARGVAYGPDGTWFASASGDFQFSFGEIAFWDTAAGLKLLSLNFGGPVEAIAVHPSGNVVGSFRATEDLVETGGAALVPGPGDWVALACDGTDGTIAAGTWGELTGDFESQEANCP